jgi:glycosyltransferase involved in cell wall biosynthesis
MPGINEAMPYGYYHARHDGCLVTYSEDAPEGPLICFARRVFRRWLGLDLLHAWRNRRSLREADVVWTHTELESLAALALLRTRSSVSRPRVIAQSVWLFGRWSEFWPPKRWLYRRLLRRADLLTVQCKDNLAAARRLLPGARVQVVPYGIDLNKMVAARPRPIHTPIRILSLGRDMHRDWPTLIAATAGRPEFDVRIGAKKISARGGNLTLVKPTSAQLPELYGWADLVVIPLKPNIHASGITVLAEAAVFGVPVVCTGTGGLHEYFGDESVRYVPPGDFVSMRRAIIEVAANDQLRFKMAQNAQARLVEDNLDTRARAKRLAALSRELLSEKICEDCGELRN